MKSNLKKIIIIMLLFIIGTHEFSRIFQYYLSKYLISKISKS